MAITLFARCEGATLSPPDDYSAGDTTWTLSGGASFTSGAAKSGTNGIRIVSGGDAASLDGAGIFNYNEGSCAFWVNRRAGADDFMLQIVGSIPSNALLIELLGSTNLMVRHRSQFDHNVTASLDDGDATPVDTWQYIVLRWDCVADLLRIDLYDTTGTLLDFAETNSAMVDQSDTFTISFSNQIGADFDYDVIMFSDDYAELLQNYRDYTSYSQFGGSPTPLFAQSSF